MFPIIFSQSDHLQRSYLLVVRLEDGNGLTAKTTQIKVHPVMSIEQSQNKDEPLTSIIPNKERPITTTPPLRDDSDATSENENFEISENEDEHPLTQSPKEDQPGLNSSESRSRVVNFQTVSCMRCHRKFAASCYLQAHYRDDHHVEDPNKFKCVFCTDTFFLKADYLKHVRVFHGHNTSGRRNFLICTCHVCGKSFYNTQALRLHLAMHSTIREFKCDTCGLDFVLSKFFSRIKSKPIKFILI